MTATRAASTRKTAAKKIAEPKPEEPVVVAKRPGKRARKAEDDEAPAPKKVRAAAAAPKAAPKAKPVAKAAAPKKEEKILTEPPKERLSIFTFGTGENGDLGLGPLPNAKEVKRPRLNPFLPIDKVGVVEVALGGMHGLVLTHDGKVYSWGVNDMCALGRDTSGDEKTREVGAESSDEDDDIEEHMNKFESTPMLVTFPTPVTITRIAAGDSISIAVTNTGRVYGWGTFRAADGILGFTESTRVQPTPIELPGLTNIIDVACGNDHVLVLDTKGTVYAWGNGQQNQLGRRVVERTRTNALTPRALTFPHRLKVSRIFSGQYHSFAITTDGAVYAWGLNGYAQTGIYEADDSESLQTIHTPQLVASLSQYEITHLAGGQHHSLAITKSGDLLTWGRMDAHQVGVIGKDLPQEHVIRDVAGKDRILTTPTKVADVKFRAADCGIDHCVAIDEHGQAWSWGFGTQYQVGQGPPARDVEVPTMIVNTATKDVDMKVVSCGGNFSTLGGVPKPLEANGVDGA
ncbi:RCC1/BLIP-II [Ascodesmis nigricans]|uniref:RCC1/BLIP-II n=1 Tax=Ascodesmis nigricans TaxID=341454 RepID=A0A4S2MPX9_9PEZI|nr:RCC1/BLIP-II [Ascodesmis nigricans]